jgi:class 3 adenylate cyclase
LIKEGNIFGDCVNVASRIESMGMPGVVLISAPVQQQLKNKPEFKLVSLGRFEFKNIDEPWKYLHGRWQIPVPRH